MILHAVFQCMNHLESLGILSEEELEEVSCTPSSSPLLLPLLRPLAAEA